MTACCRTSSSACNISCYKKSEVACWPERQRRDEERKTCLLVLFYFPHCLFSNREGLGTSL